MISGVFNQKRETAEGAKQKSGGGDFRFGFSLWHHAADAGLVEFDPHVVRDFDHHGFVFDLRNNPMHAACGHNFVTGFDSGDHIQMFLLALALGPDEEEIKDQNKKADLQEQHLKGGTGGCGTSRSGFGLGEEKRME